MSDIIIFYIQYMNMQWSGGEQPLNSLYLPLEEHQEARGACPSCLSPTCRGCSRTMPRVHWGVRGGRLRRLGGSRPDPWQGFAGPGRALCQVSASWAGLVLALLRHEWCLLNHSSAMNQERVV